MAQIARRTYLPDKTFVDDVVEVPDDALVVDRRMQRLRAAQAEVVNISKGTSSLTTAQAVRLLARVVLALLNQSLNADDSSES